MIFRSVISCVVLLQGICFTVIAGSNVCFSDNFERGDAGIRQFRVRTNVLVKNKAETTAGQTNHYLSICPADKGKKFCQIMKNFRPQTSVAGIKLHFSAKVRGSGNFDVGIVPLMQGKDQDGFFCTKQKLTNQWRMFDFEFDLTRRYPDQLLFWVRLYGENSNLDIDDLTLEQRFDAGVKLTPPSRCLIVRAGDKLPALSVGVSGAKNNLPGHFVYLQPSGKLVKLPAKLNNGKYTLPVLPATEGTHHFALSAGGYSCPFTVIALRQDAYQHHCQAAEQLTPGNALNILLLGDSLSAFRKGYNWVSIVESRLKELHPRSAIYNYACGGDSIRHVMKRLSGHKDVSFANHYQDMTNRKYDLVLIFLGQNDTVAYKKTGFTQPQVNEKERKDSFDKTFAALRKFTEAPVVIFSGISTPQEVNTANAGKFGYRFGIPALVENYNQQVRQLCEKNHFSFWDIYTPFSGLSSKAVYFQADGVHVNDSGNVFLASIVMRKLAEYLKMHPAVGEKYWRVDTPAPGMWVLRNESASWKGLNAKGVVPQNGPALVVRKQFDLSALPPEAIAMGKEVYLRMFVGILDYSICKPGKPNGLTEELFIRLNGREKRYKTSDALFPRTDDPKKKRRQEWCDIPIPAEVLKENGILTVDFGKAVKGDDFLYPGFDGSKPGVDSFVSYDGGKKFSKVWQNAPFGELMMRLVVTKKREVIQAVYDFETGKKEDPLPVFPLVEKQKELSYFEFAPEVVDFSRPVTLNVEYSGANTPEAALKFQDGDAPHRVPGKVVNPGCVQFEFSGAEIPFSMTLFARGSTIRKVTLRCNKVLQSLRRINMNPAMNQPRGKRRVGGNQVKYANGELLLSTPALEMSLATSSGIALKKIYCADPDSSILRFPQQSGLFLIRVGGKVYSAQQAKVTKVTTHADGGTVVFTLPGTALTGELVGKMTGDEISWHLNIANSGKTPQHCTVVFPHVDGLAVSDAPDGDYYLFPYGGGLIADCNAVLRSVYGINDAWYQLVDLFSPERGGGFAMRIADTDTIFKGFNLRKGKEAEFSHKITAWNRAGRTAQELMLTEPLVPGHGTGIAVDYQRKIIAPGAKIVLPAAVFSSHAGNWKVPMKRYAAWAHKVWQFRPYPSRLTGLWNDTAGWGVGGSLWKDGKYHERYIFSNADLIELNSYWTVSPVAPWDTPINKLHELGPTAVRQRTVHFGYWVDPATGKDVWAYNRGDYDGYNPQWGGLPAFQKHIRKMREKGKTMLLYTDPIIVCPTTKLGKSKGGIWGAVNPAWKDPFNCPKNPSELKGHIFHYFSYCMCLNNPDYSAWVAKNMARLIRETGVDGIRLDEYGHGGYICVSKEHPHIFPGNGENVWLRAIKNNVLAIRAETDKFKKDAIIMAEFLGVDSLSAALDGALSYDVGRRTNAIRPLAVNLFRFYFPECKLYELDETNTNKQKDVWLFNAVGVYNSALYPPEYHDILKKYTRAFNGEVEPLVDTLIPYVYANRFAAPDRSVVVHTIFNKTGHSVNAPLLVVTPAPGRQFINAFTGEKLVPQKLQNGTMAIVAKVDNNKVFVVAELKK